MPTISAALSLELSLIQIEKEKRGVDPEKFMAYIRSKVVGEGMYYLLLDCNW